MEYQKLNIDVFCEIFKYFVAIDDEGPLKLIMVCTLWQDLVISNPLYWTWITIGDNIGRFDARIRKFDALSAGRPLQLTIRLPVQNVDRFQSLFRRCIALFIDKCGKLDSLEIERDVEGICKILKTPSATSIERIYWYDRDEPSSFSPRSLQKQLFKADELDLKPLFNAFPAIIISAVRLKPRTHFITPQTLPKVSYSNLFKALSNLPHLTLLHISTDHLSGILEEAMIQISLPLLNSLSLTISLPSSDPNWSILRYIIAPSVHSVCLAGCLEYGHIFAGASELGKSMRPKKLTLEIFGTAYFSRHGMQTLDYNLASVEYLSVSLQAPSESLAAPSRWWEVLHSVRVSMPYLEVFDLRFSGNLPYFQEIIGPVSCDLHVHCQSPFQREPRPSMQLWTRKISTFITDKPSTLIDPLLNPRRRVERMTILISRYQRGLFGQLNVSISSVKTLIIRVDKGASSGFDSRLPSTRLAWLESLQELDIRGVEFYNLYEFSDTGGSLPNLVILKCPIRAAIQLIKYTPQLRKLTIVESDPVMPITDQWNFDNLMILATTNGIDRWPPLSSIALEFYPRWKAFLDMVTMYSRPHENQRETILRSVKLPALPHPSVLRPLVSALRGQRVAAKHIPSISVSSWQNKGCDFCHQSRWKCVHLTKGYCGRHSLRNLVTITADTLGA
jgi:hypothetical protein